MRAIIHDRYGPIDTLEARDIDPPVIGAGDVLVRVRAAGLHVGDVFAVTGSPFPVRVESGLRRPKYGVPGYDLGGVVEAVGAGVTRFAPGDEVLGVTHGSAAELARSGEDDLVPKPASLSFEEAAALPTSGLAALHGLRDAARLAAGQRLLVNGASGGVGSFAVQIAKAMGAHVTGVTSTANVDFVRGLGADAVIDYTREDFTAGDPGYDVIFDNVENRPLAEMRRALAPRGTLVLNSGTGATGMAMAVRLLKPLVLAPFTGQRLVRFLSTPNRADLEHLVGLVEQGALRPCVGRTFRLEETAAALAHIEAGHARGKVVVAV